MKEKNMANTISKFAQKHRVGDWCKPILDDVEKPPVLKFGKLDVPAMCDNRNYCTPVEDQGSKPWCAAYTAAAFAENVLWRRDGRIKQIEPDWIYKYAKQHDGDPLGDGTTLNCVLDALMAKDVFDPGICSIRRVGRGWHGTDELDVKAAIHRFGCFLAGFNITEEWYKLSLRNVFEIRGEKSASMGGHAVLVCGYTPKGVWIENSWGASWGYHGFGFMSWEAFREQYMYGTVLTNCLNGFK